MDLRAKRALAIVEDQQKRKAEQQEEQSRQKALDEIRIAQTQRDSVFKLQRMVAGQGVSVTTAEAQAALNLFGWDIKEAGLFLSTSDNFSRIGLRIELDILRRHVAKLEKEVSALRQESRETVRRTATL